MRILSTKLWLVAFVTSLAVLQIGCSFVTSFTLENNSDRSIEISYVLAEDGYCGFSPRLENKNRNSNDARFVDFPAERLVVDLTTRAVKFRLLSDETAEICSMSDRSRLEEYEKKFNLTSLRIQSAEGSIALEGRSVFQSFRPVKSGPLTFGPDIIGFVYEYR